MFLHKIHLDPHCREARRDLADPYQLHSTLCRAFSKPARKCPAGEFLWRLEPETGPNGYPRILVQSKSLPDWSRIGVRGWLAAADPAIDLKDRLKLDALKPGQRFRFRLRANPTVNRNGKRLGLLRLENQEKWIVRKGEQHGFSLPKVAETTTERVDVKISYQQMLDGRQHAGNDIRVFSVLYDGIITVTNPVDFRTVLQTGIGHGKVLGLGLLSVAPTAKE